MIPYVHTPSRTQTRFAAITHRFLLLYKRETTALTATAVLQVDDRLIVELKYVFGQKKQQSNLFTSKVRPLLHEVQMFFTA